MLTYFARISWVEAPATSRHTHHPLWLLPSGPDQVHELVLREDQGPHSSLQLVAEEWEGLSGIPIFIATPNQTKSIDFISTAQQLSDSVIESQGLIERVACIMTCPAAFFIIHGTIGLMDNIMQRHMLAAPA